MQQSQRRGRPVVYLHVGAMKTGTTYLQRLMYANRDSLLEAGVALPGRTWVRQVRGVQDVLRLSRRDTFIRKDSVGAWDELLTDISRAPRGVSVISMEFLSFATPRKIRRLMDTLAEVDVKVVLTVRDLASVLPSQWQTMVHNGTALAWPDYLAGIPDPGIPRVVLPRTLRRLTGERGINFHRNQNIARMVHQWGQVVPPESLHVVTVPQAPSEPDQLWQRFAGVIGVDPRVATKPPTRTNPSLGYASTEFIRRINERIGRLPQSEYNWTVKEPIALRLLTPRARMEERASLSRTGYDIGLAWNRLNREVIEATGAAVTGSLDDLPVEVDEDRRSRLPDQPPPPDTDDMLAAAEVVAGGLRRVTRRRARRLRRRGAEVDVVSWPTVERQRAEWMATDDPVSAASVELAAQARQAALLLRRIRELRAQSS